MKKKMIFLFSMFFLMVSFLAGCSRVRTYTVEKERVDQNLRQGNQGYLMGESKEAASAQERRMTRKTYVTEVELGALPAKKRPAGVSKKEGLVEEVVEEPAIEPMMEEATEAVQPTAIITKFNSYTVEPNDTLQKISLKFYGTTKKWKKIYDANTDKLKSPDRIYAGQVLKIPQE